MTTIYKYPIRIEDEQMIEMPFGAKCIHVGLDPDETPCIWAKVESTNTPEPVRVFIAGTGHPLPDEPAEHVGSFKQAGFMWHVFIG